MSGGRGRAGGGGNASASRATSAAKRRNRAPSPATPSRWPAAAAAAAGADSSSSFGELWGAVNAVAAATGIKKKQAEREGRESMLELSSPAAKTMLEPTATRTTIQQPPQPRPRPQQRDGGIIRAHRPAAHRRPPGGRPVSARATAASGAAAEASEFPSAASPPPLLPAEIAARLDHAPPALSALDFAVALLASASAFALTSALAQLRSGGGGGAAAASRLLPPLSLAAPLPPLALLAALAAGALALSAARERAFAARSFTARELADPDSRFAELLGVEVHYKVAEPAGNPAEGGGGGGGGGGARGAGRVPARFSIAAMHGFGAAAFSWSLVARPLADRLGARFTKHDMPGFGLTERPSKLGLAPYSLAFNGRLARAVMDLEQERGDGGGGGGGGGGGAGPASSRSRPLRVLMGHSLGAVCAAAEAARDPGGVDALVLVAPAIVAASSGTRGRNGGGGAGGAAPEAETEAEAKRPKTTFSTLPMRLLSAAALLLSSVAALLAGWAARALIVLTWPFLVFLLRAAVRSFAFWESGLSAALGGQRASDGPPPGPSEAGGAGLTPAGIPLWLSQRYRLPSLVRGWETGLLLFLLARVPVASGGFPAALARAAGDARRVLLRGRSASSSSPSSPPPPPPALTSGPPAARLAAAVRGGRVPLLVVHGDRDALVPLGNSARLVEQLTGDVGGDSAGEKGNAPLCELVVLRDRGHTPQEEAPREFIEAVAAFLERVEREKEKERR